MQLTEEQDTMVNEWYNNIEKADRVYLDPLLAIQAMEEMAGRHGRPTGLDTVL